MQIDEPQVEAAADLLGLLAARAERTTPVADVDVLLERLEDMGATSALLMLSDYEQLCLRPAPGRTCRVDTEPISIEGTLVGRCYSTQSSITIGAEEGWHILVPVVERSERLGVLDVTVPADRRDLEPAVEMAASVLAFLVVSGNRYTDAFRLARRRREMTLQAEIQWGSLPPMAFNAPEVSVCGQLEPAYAVGGDVFDYSLNGDVLDVAIFDGMGHDLDASLLASLALQTYRHGRTLGRDLVAQRHEIDRLLRERFEPGRFVTGVMGSLELSTGTFCWVNAGHPRPLLLRGRHVVDELAVPPALPMGLGWSECIVGTCDLQPTDILLLFTDGVTEARPASGDQPFGVEGLRDFLEREAASEHLDNETLRRLTSHLVAQAADGRLSDDATLLLINWGEQD